MKYKDLREWIHQAEEIGELVHVLGADTRYEIGAIDAITSRNQGPAVLFENSQRTNSVSTSTIMSTAPPLRSA